jgi:hypothetical protein
MQTPSTSTGQRDPLTRTRKPLSPINAAQRAGYKLDAVQDSASPQARPAAPANTPAHPHSAGAQPH